MSDDLVAIFESIGEALKSDPTIQDLREVRTRLDSHLLSANVRDTLRRLNDQDRIGAVRDAAMQCRRTAEDLAAKRLDIREIIRIGAIGGGAGLGAGAIAGAMALAAPAVALIPFIGAGYIIWRGIHASRALSEEASLLGNIVDRIKELLVD